GGPATLNGSGDLSYVRTFLDLLEQWQTAGTVADWVGFQEAVKQLYAAPSPDNTNDEDSQSPQTVIQLMTIHKSKGLEFDHVILPGLTRTSGSDKKPLLRWSQHIDDHNQLSLVMAPLGAHDQEDDSVYKYLKQEDTFKARLENTRVLYVAATRAIRNLYLSASLNPTTNDGWKKPGKGSLLAPIWKTIEKGIDEQRYSVEQEIDSDTTKSKEKSSSPLPSASLNHIRRLPSEFKAQIPSRGSMLVNSEETQSVTENQTEQNLSNRARLMGTVLHRTLKQIANEGINNWPENRIDTMPSAWAAQLKEQGILATSEELASLSSAISTMLADPKGQWILHNHEKAQSEQALGYYQPEQNRAGTSVIDRTFIDQGLRWIIDYKFSAPAESETQSQFIARQTQTYQGQLKHYANLYKGLEKNPVRCALYFPQIPLFIEVDAE
ncbi:MAG: 3'-5' exonuclease, partial [Porticoccaceae bacterium]|nr:3'-5' exonuclease [Porticoccaceae bacterium]